MTMMILKDKNAHAHLVPPQATIHHKAEAPPQPAKK